MHGSTPGLGAGTGQSASTVINPGCQTRFGKFCLGACGVPAWTGARKCMLHGIVALSSFAAHAAT